MALVEEGKKVLLIATAIANARGGRRGVPVIENVLDILPQKLRDEVIDDAKAVARALDADGGKEE